MRKYRAILSLVFLVILTAGYFYKQSLNNSCPVNYRRDTVVRTDKSAIEAEVAKTDAAQEKGLGGRECIGGKQGMLFIFDKSDYYQFWMKDMKFPIDIVWIDSSKKVIQINRNVSPDTYPANFTTAQPSKYVLELKANTSTKLGIQKNTHLNF